LSVNIGVPVQQNLHHAKGALFARLHNEGSVLFAEFCVHIKLLDVYQGERSDRQLFFIVLILI
jgi:hypothetical protein